MAASMRRDSAHHIERQHRGIEGDRRSLHRFRAVQKVPFAPIASSAKTAKISGNAIKVPPIGRHEPRPGGSALRQWFGAFIALAMNRGEA